MALDGNEAKAFEATTHAVVGISFRNPDWAEQVARAFANPDTFSPSVLGP